MEKRFSNFDIIILNIQKELSTFIFQNYIFNLADQNLIGFLYFVMFS